jgi:hypothetical protein
MRVGPGLITQSVVEGWPDRKINHSRFWFQKNYCVPSRAALSSAAVTAPTLFSRFINLDAIWIRQRLCAVLPFTRQLIASASRLCGAVSPSPLPG